MNRNKKKTSSSEEELFLFDDDVDTTTIIETLIKEEKHLEAARVIRKIQSHISQSQQQSQQSFFFDTDEYYRKILQKAELIERAVKELLSSPEKEVIDNDDDDNDDNDNDNDNDDDEWIKQGGSHRYSNYEYTIYYKIDDKARLTCRIESPVPTTLLVPLLSVLNESSLYQTWIPSWTTPIKLGIKESNQLLQDSRGHQIIQVQCHVGPWPIRVREACFSVLAVDDIETNGFIIATMTSLLSSSSSTTTINNANANANNRTQYDTMLNLPSTFQIPDCTTYGMVPCDFDGSILIRICPKDHPHYEKTKQKFGNSNRTNSSNNENENENTNINTNINTKTKNKNEILLVQFMMHFDAKLSSSFVPQSMINFITRTAIGVGWNRLLQVAEQVRDGTRSQHCHIIQQKVDFYQWVEERCHYMVQVQQQQHNQQQHRCQRQQQNLSSSLSSSGKDIEEDEEGRGEEYDREQQQQQQQQQQQSYFDKREDDITNTNTLEYNNVDYNDWTLQDVLRMNM